MTGYGPVLEFFPSDRRFEFEVTGVLAIPEPAVALQLLCGLLVLAIASIRRRHAARSTHAI
jgi:hypothetical protein